ncbi:MAG: oligosaccharide flippase family protein [Methanomicrobiales archaeon]|nr:oligosaccharide flippase family protein [Methanomicrobiales archaeon]
MKKTLSEKITKIISYNLQFIKRDSLICQIIYFITNNPYYKGVFILGVGTASAQLIGILSVPIITRLYDPSDFGVLAVYSSILAIVGIGATFSYQTAFSLTKNEVERSSLLSLCILILISTTIGLILIFFIGKTYLYTIFNLRSIEEYSIFLIIGFFGMGLYSILNEWAIRERDYKRITYTKINQGIAGSLSKIILGILSYGATGLIIGHILFQIAGIGTFVDAMLKKDKEILKFRNLQNIVEIAKKFNRFPLFTFPAMVVNTIALQIPPIMLLNIYNSQIVGYFALAQMLLILPESVIASAISQAYIGEASKMIRDESRNLRLFYLQTMKKLIMIALPLIGIPTLFAPYILPIILGSEWVEAGWYCWPLSLMVITEFIVSPPSLLSQYGFNHWKLVYDVFRAAGVISGFLICQLYKTPVIITLMVYSVIMTFFYIIMVFVVLKAIENFTTTFSKDTA